MNSIALPLAFLAAWARVVIASILFIAGLTKFRDRRRLGHLIENYQLVSRPIAQILARLLPEIEIVTALFLIGTASSTPLVVSLFLFGTFACAIGVNLLRGRGYIPCGCFGPNENISLTWSHVVQNTILAAIAVITIGAPTSLHPMNQLVVLFCAAISIGSWWLIMIAARMWNEAQ